MKATAKDFYTGSKLQNKYGATITIQEKYDDGAWNARLTHGTRYIGEKVVWECEATTYTVK